MKPHDFMMRVVKLYNNSSTHKGPLLVPVFTPIGPLQVSVYWPCSTLLGNTQRQIATEKTSDYILLYVTITTCCICSYGQMFVLSETELDKVH